MEKRRKLKRQFLGKVGNKLSDFTDKQEMQFEKKHLKAYLRGDEKFITGYDCDPNSMLRTPIYVKVQQKLSFID
jgi:hypothetical protein